jgi:STE24 endopeptidase
MSSLFYLVIGIILVMFLIETYVSILNYQYRRTPIPGNVKGVYDETAYQKWLAYTMTNFKFQMIKHVVSTLVLLGLLMFGMFGIWEGIVNGWIGNSAILQTLFFILGFVLLTEIINLPFNYYATFVIEERYGFNKTKKKTFYLDFIKNLILTFALLGGVVALLNWIYLIFIDQIWIFIFGAWAVLSLVLVAIFLLNTVFVKLFNKLKPMEESELKNKIDALGKKLGFEVNRIFVMDASKRSSKLNAFFSGLGKKREVVLFDTLIEKMSEEEILSVLAHELGHATYKDTTSMLVQRIATFLLYAVILGTILQSAGLAAAFGLSGIHFGFALLLFTIFMSPLNFILGIPLNYFSRVAEYRADAFAAKHISKDAMITALKVLAKENFSNLTPHPLYVLLNYSHPTISERITSIDRS